MTALSVWWRRNFGHRNDPPAMLPDPVTWTFDVPAFQDVQDVIRVHQDDGWTYEEAVVRGGRIQLRFRREDGAYRWRDDGFRGF